MPNINDGNIASIQFKLQATEPPTPAVNFVDVYVDTSFTMNIKDSGGNVTPVGSFNSFDVAGSTGTPQTISDSDTLTIAGGTNISTVAGATDTVTINFSGTLPITSGGTGQTTQQAAIDSLTAVSGATNEYVLTKDTGSGNALWKAIPGGVGSIVKIPTASDNLILPNGDYIALQLQADTSATSDILQILDENGNVTFRADSRGWLGYGQSSYSSPFGMLDEFTGDDVIGRGAAYIGINWTPSSNINTAYPTGLTVGSYFNQSTSPSSGWVTGLGVSAGISSTGTIPVRVVDLSGSHSGNSGTLPDMRFINIASAFTAGGPITVVYGLYVNSQTAATTNYAIYTNTGDIRLMSSATDKIGFHGSAPVAKQTVAGSRGGNAALADLLTKLATLGLIVDGTSA